MNFVLVTGSNISRRSLAENIVNFCIEELMPRMRTLDIEVKIRSMKDEGAIGFCLETDNRDNLPRNDSCLAKCDS